MPDHRLVNKYIPDRAIYRPVRYGEPVAQLRGREAQIRIGLQVLADRAQRILWRDLQMKYGLSKARLRNLAKLACQTDDFAQCAEDGIVIKPSRQLSDAD